MSDDKNRPSPGMMMPKEWPTPIRDPVKEYSYVAVLECADGNDVAGTAWIETHICTGETTLAELMAWKEKQRGAHGKLSITKAT